MAQPAYQPRGRALLVPMVIIVIRRSRALGVLLLGALEGGVAEKEAVVEKAAVAAATEAGAVVAEKEAVAEKAAVAAATEAVVAVATEAGAVVAVATEAGAMVAAARAMVAVAKEAAMVAAAKQGAATVVVEMEISVRARGSRLRWACY